MVLRNTLGNRPRFLAKSVKNIIYMIVYSTSSISSIAEVNDNNVKSCDEKHSVGLLTPSLKDTHELEKGTVYSRINAHVRCKEFYVKL